MLRRFLKDSMTYGVPAIVTNGISLVTIPLYTRVLAPRDYGMLDILLVAAAFVNVIVTVEINQGFGRLQADASSDEEKRVYASTTIWFTLAMYSLFLCAALAFASPLSILLLGSDQWSSTIQIASGAMASSGTYIMLQNQLRWRLQARHYALASMLFTVTATGIAVFLVVARHWGISGIFAGQICGALLSGTVAWYYGRSAYALLFSWKACISMIRFSFPLVFSSINVFIALYIDRIAIQKFLTLSDVGLYGLGYRLASVVSLLVAGFNSALSPIIFSAYRDASTPADIEKMLRVFLSLTLPVVVAVSVFAQEALWLLTTPQYYPAWVVIPLIASALLLSSLYIFSPGMDIAKKTRLITFINIAVAALNVILNFLLIPLLGIQGAALATLASAAFMFACYIHFGRKYYPIPYGWRSIFPAFGITAAAIMTKSLVLTRENIGTGASALAGLVILFVSTYFIMVRLIGREVIAAFVRDMLASVFTSRRRT